MIIDYFRQGVKNLRQRSLRSILTMIGIFIGVALVVALLSLGQGMQEAIIGQFSSLGAETLTVQAKGGGFGPPGSYQSVTIGEDDLRAVKRVPGIEDGFGRLIESVRVHVDDEPDFGYAVSIPDDSEEYDLAITIPNELVTSEGRLIKPGDKHKVTIGYNLAARDQLVRALRVGDKFEIEGETFDVVGVVEKTGNPQLDNVLWVPESSLRELVGEDEKYGLIMAKVGDSFDVDATKERVEKALRKERDVELGKEDFVVESSQEVIDSLNSVVGAVKWFLIGIAAISLLVGGVGITNTMYTSVLERTREIGIMKAIGGKNSDILLIFLIESGLLGVVGGIIGIVLGMGLAFLVAGIAQQALGTDLIAAHISVSLLLFAILGSFVVGAVAGITPARQAAKMQPVEALNGG